MAMEERNRPNPSERSRAGGNSIAPPRGVQESNVWRKNGLDGGGEERLAGWLGWFSLGLGIAGLAAPREVARLIGAPDDDRTRDVLRTVGVREIVSGLGLLSGARPSGWLWSRVAGDVMDLALLNSARKSGDGNPERLTAATAAIAGVTALDLYASQQVSSHAEPESSGDAHATRRYRIHRAKAVTIQRPVEEVYAFWRDFRNLPRFMSHLEAVEVLDATRSHWAARAPAGSTVEWDAEITEDHPNELIAWRSLPGSEVENSGHVRFNPAPRGRGTEVRVELQYAPPAGRLGAAVARLFGEEPGQQVQADLRRFKQLMETGEVVISESTLYGHGFPQHPAQTPAHVPAQIPATGEVAS